MLQICGIDPEHVMAIGDNESDATMFDVVKFSVAVANADDFTKSKASFVTSSNEDKGVLLAIKHFLRQRMIKYGYSQELLHSTGIQMAGFLGERKQKVFMTIFTQKHCIWNCRTPKVFPHCA